MKRAIVVGGGISGLATAYLLQKKAQSAKLELEVVLLEQERRIGGKIWSIKDEGYLCEWGPNGFLDNKPQTLELCRGLGATSQLLRSNDNARKRFIYSEGKLHQLPENGPSFLKSKLISWPGKLRLALEPFAGKPPQDVDETLAAFARRRLGDEALRKLIGPMVGGIFAGDPETMSLQSCFPRIAELEKEYGSLIMAMIKLAKQKKKDIAAGKAVASAAGPGGVLTSFRGGIQTLTDILAAQLGSSVVMPGQKVLRVTKGNTVPYRVTTESGEMEADAVILATPAYASSEIVQQLDTYMNHALAEIPYSSLVVVCFGYERRKIEHDLPGIRLSDPQRGRDELPGHPVGFEHLQGARACRTCPAAQHGRRGLSSEALQVPRHGNHQQGSGGPEDHHGDQGPPFVHQAVQAREGDSPVCIAARADGRDA